jgi:hypothetical protein
MLGQKKNDAAVLSGMGGGVRPVWGEAKTCMEKDEIRVKWKRVLSGIWIRNRKLDS